MHENSRIVKQTLGGVLAFIFALTPVFSQTPANQQMNKVRGHFDQTNQQQPGKKSPVRLGQAKKRTYAKEVSKTKAQELIAKSRVPVVVDYWATWCGPCQALSPAVEELAREYRGKILFLKVNVGDDPLPEDVPIPKLLFYQHGKLVRRQTDAYAELEKNKANIKPILDEMLEGPMFALREDFHGSQEDLFNTLALTDKPVVMEFWAPCPPCRIMENKLDALAEDYRGMVRFYRYNVNENPRTDLAPMLPLVSIYNHQTRKFEVIVGSHKAAMDAVERALESLFQTSGNLQNIDAP
ncbi:MAG: thioredoxin family protein [Elusimicrobia bacterium]|nr:thioredoxin family protein [Elusimicrobiota bacterium]